MELRIIIDEVDYGALAAKLLPLVPDGADLGPMSLLLGGVKNSPSLIKGVVDALPREKKDELVAGMINRNNGKICAAIADTAAKEGVTVKLSRVAARP